MHCPACRFQNPPGFRFCGQCGEPLPRETAASSVVPSFILEGPDAERRQLTVMFCDMVGSTALAERVDPEDLREILGQYRASVVDEIEIYGGHIAKYLGDGLVVYFGYPLAHEDDALRGVLAGLGLVQAIGRLNTRHAREGRPHIEVRVGIHTGLVVAGEIGQGDMAESLAIVGRTPNVAARLEEVAAPNSVVISDATHRLVEGYFAVTDLGRPTLKGVSEPVRAFRVDGPTGARRRIDLPRGARLTPLVGREREMKMLEERWERARAGNGQVVLLEGEAGIGKTRLVVALREALRGTLHYRLESRAAPYYRNSAFSPVIDLLQREIGHDRADSPETRQQKLEQRLIQQDLGDPETVSLFAALLGIAQASPLPPDLPPERRKQMTIDAVASWLWALATRFPVLLMVEDLQWIDPSTLELLDRIIDGAPAHPILVVLTFRPPFRPPWAASPDRIHIPLGRLSAPLASAMIDGIAGGPALPRPLVRTIVERADGIPLFIEELTRMVLESADSDRTLSALAIPRSLSDLLTARLDRLGTAKEVMQLAAMLGRQFTYEVLAALAPLDDEALRWEVGVLVDAGLLLQYGEPPHGWYLFQHTLIQEAAYESLLRTTREHYHRKIAQILETRFPEVSEAEPELLAHHYAAAGEPMRAITYWLTAGERSMASSAYEEAIGHLTRAREVLEAIPPGAERRERELAILAVLGPATMVTRGWSAPEVEEIHARALEISREAGESIRVGPPLYGLYAVHFVRGKHRRARELATELLELGERLGDDGVILEGHVAKGYTDFWGGDLAGALAHFDRVQVGYDYERHRGHALLYGRDPMVSSLTQGALALWLIGRPERSLETMQEALGLAQRLSHPVTLAWPLCFLAMLHLLRNEPDEARRRSEELVALAGERQPFAFWYAWGSFLTAWARAAAGEWAEGADGMARALEDCRAIGAGIALPYFEGLQAYAVGRAGDARTGADLLGRAAAASEQSDERWYLAELHRMRGDLLARAGDMDAARGCFEEAESVAREQGATALAARSAAGVRMQRDASPTHAISRPSR
jgi:class 3 adenylate cyclase/predicted ATPase